MILPLCNFRQVRVLFYALQAGYVPHEKGLCFPWQTPIALRRSSMARAISFTLLCQFVGAGKSQANPLKRG